MPDRLSNIATKRKNNRNKKPKKQSDYRKNSQKKY